MLNLIKMDMYRLMKIKALWIFLLLAAVTPFMELAIRSKSAEEGIQAGISLTTIMDGLFHYGIIMLSCSVLVSIFVNAEQRNGFIKNIAGQLPNRGALALSKIITAVFGTLLLMVCLLVCGIAAGVIFYGDGFTLGSVADLASLFGIQLLLHAAFSSLIVFFCLVTQSSAFSMTFGIIISSGIVSIAYLGVNKLVSMLGGRASGFDIGSYMLENNINAIHIGSTGMILTKALIVGAAFLLAAGASSMLLMKKRDIR